MKEELKKYLDELFEKAPKTRAAFELKEELLANSNERYDDLVKDGMAEEKAMNTVINSIGDMDQLFAEVDINKGDDREMNDEIIKKIALYKTIAVGIYILGFAFAFPLGSFFSAASAFSVLLIMAALATCILVYVGAAYPKYRKQEDTMVEEFKEWSQNTKQKKAIRSSVTTIIWMVVLILYFVISFATMAWYITWVMFLVGACAQAICTLIFNLKDLD